jgi:hypothetical protein
MAGCDLLIEIEQAVGFTEAQLPNDAVQKIQLTARRVNSMRGLTKKVEDVSLSHFEMQTYQNYQDYGGRFSFFRNFYFE